MNELVVIIVIIILFFILAYCHNHNLLRIFGGARENNSDSQVVNEEMLEFYQPLVAGQHLRDELLNSRAYRVKRIGSFSLYLFIAPSSEHSPPRGAVYIMERANNGWKLSKLSENHINANEILRFSSSVDPLRYLTMCPLGNETTMGPEDVSPKLNKFFIGLRTQNVDLPQQYDNLPSTNAPQYYFGFQTVTNIRGEWVLANLFVAVYEGRQRDNTFTWFLRRVGPTTLAGDDSNFTINEYGIEWDDRNGEHVSLAFR